VSRLPSLGPRGEGWLALQLLLMAAIVGSAFVLPPSLAGTARLVAGVVGVLLVGGGIAVVALAVGQLGAAATPLPRPQPTTQLVDSGPYRYVRHPIYVGVLLSALGFALLMSSLAALLLVCALAVLLDLKARREEAWLLEHDPAYGTYMRRTRRFIPRLY
jgi:protein-S-isoprenylcysteine O-methyltransferase Ste14